MQNFYEVGAIGTALKRITWKYYSLVFLSFLFVQETQAQTTPLINSTLTGTIRDAKTNETLPGVNVRINGTTHAALTDNHGVFKFVTGQKFPYTLTISFVGYKTTQVVAAGSPIEVKLEVNVKELEDVVVIAYGRQRRKDITGSVSSVSKESLQQVSPSVDNLLRGAAPGVQVTQSSGQPGASSSVRIRGGNSITGGNEPLYVIDGFPVYNDNSNVSTGAGSGAGLNALATINPNDIESVEILKDASATAIYGSRGANGVILIATKKGTKGSNNISYHGYYGRQKLNKELNLLNASQWAELRNDILASINQPPSFSDSQIAALGKGTDWQDAGFKEAPVQNHELSFSGGDEKSRYAISGNYFDQQGILVNTGFKRYSARINYEKDVFKGFKIGTNATGSYGKLKGTLAHSGVNSPNAVSSLLLAPPVVPLKNADGSYNVNNPYATVPFSPILDLVATVNHSLVDRLLGNFYAEYAIGYGLTAKVSVGTDILSARQEYFAPANTLNGYTSKGVASIGNKQVRTILNENTLSYDKAFDDDHRLNVLLGYTTQKADGKLSVAGSSNFVTDAIGYNSLQGGSVSAKPLSDAYDWTLNSYLARINYSLLNKYNFTFSGRADGSSRFGAGNKWGYFPSAGFSWNVNQENFLKDQTAVSNLKLRLSAGTLGNQEIGQYLSLAVLNSTNYNFNRTAVIGFAPQRLSNRDLKWEKTTQYNAGLDIGLLGNRISVVADWYYKKTTDLLLNVPIPLSTGYTTALQNIGSLENKGFELAINSENFKNDDFSWKTSLVYALNRNKVLSLGESRNSFFADITDGTLKLLQPVIVQVGQPLGTFYGYKTDGIFQSAAEIAQSPSITPGNTFPGDRRYKDLSGPAGTPDGAITTADKVILGNAQPKFSGGITNVFGYKNFELLVFLQGSYGNKVYNAIKQQLEITTLGTNVSADIANRWKPGNPSNEIPRASSSPVAQMSDRYIEDGSYLRLKNISLGYEIPKSKLSGVGAKQIKLYVSAQNLVTWTKYSGYDPEVSSFEQSNIIPGIDYGGYPNYRTFIAGVNLIF